MMRKMSWNLKRFAIVFLALGCVALEFLYPAWRTVAFAQGYQQGYCYQGYQCIPSLSTTFGGPSSSKPQGASKEPVNTATGNYYYQHIDLSLSGRGLPLVFTRTLNVQDNTTGPFGLGWTHSYNLKLTENPDNTIVIKMGDGHEEFYDPTGGAYQPHDPGVFNSLVKNGDGTFNLKEKNQTTMVFTAAGGFPV